MTERAPAWPATATPVVFSHANSFGAGTYGQLFGALRARGLQVHALDKFGHDPRYPVSSNWPHLVQQLIDYATPLAESAGGPLWLVGHSFGGYLSLMAASRMPALARGVLLLDSPLLGGWRASAVSLAKRTALVGSMSPGAVSRKRRNQWASEVDALAHFQAKKVFARWDPQVLADYVASGTHEAQVDGQPRRVLSFAREVETAIYNSLPHHLEGMLSRHPVKCPVSFIGGLQSSEIRQVGLDLTRRITRGRLLMLDGSHLFPMERPLVTAAAIETALLDMAAG